MSKQEFPGWHGTTIIGVKKDGEVVIAGDGQVSLGQTVIKGTARKVRRLSPGGFDVVAGFAGSTADAFTLLERLEAKLEATPGQLARASVELAKDWRTDRYLRRLEAMMLVADKSVSLVLTGTGDVDHLGANVASILKPPLPVEDLATLRELFGDLAGFSLDPPTAPRRS